MWRESRPSGMGRLALAEAHRTVWRDSYKMVHLPSLPTGILLVSRRPEDGGPTIQLPAAGFAAPFVPELRAVYDMTLRTGVKA